MILLRRLALVVLLAAGLAACTTAVPGTARPTATPVPAPRTIDPASIQFRFVVTDGTGGAEVTGRDGKSYVLGPVLLDGSKVRSAQSQFQAQYSQWVVNVELDSEGTTVFGQATSEHVGEQLAIVVADEVVSAPVIQSPITGGQIQITGNFSRDEAELLADRLNGR